MTDLLPALRNLSPALREQLMRQLSGAARPAPPVDAPGPRGPDGPEGPPLSFAQERQWFLDRLSPADPAHAIVGALRLTGTLNVEALSRACDGIIARHATLRARFSAPGGQPAQTLDPAGPVPIRRIDLSSLDPAAAGTECDRIYREEAARGFDLARDLLLRLILVRLSAEDHLLIFSHHHIASDGLSIGILLEELAAGYAAHVRGETPALPALALDYADLAAWQRRRMAAGGLAASLDYWRRQLADAPPPWHRVPTRRHTAPTRVTAPARYRP